MSGPKRDPRKPREKKPLPDGWIVVPSKTYPDRVYFFNTVTRCSTWNNPCEDKTNDEYNNNSSRTQSPEVNSSSRTKRKSLGTSQSKKYKSRATLNSPDKSSSSRINSEIEDYDDQDQYFADAPQGAFSTSHSRQISPPSSPHSSSSIRSNMSDSDNVLLENNKKELWTHFISSPKKSKVRRSIALSDFQEPSTGQNPETEKSEESDRSSNNNFTKSKKKKKKKKQQSEKNNKSRVEKIIMNVSFKKSDETSSQKRLLKLRKQNAEKLKDLAAKYPELGLRSDVGRHLKISRTPACFDAEGQTRNLGFGNSNLKDTESHNTTGQDADASVDFSEEMDWEPSSEESDVKNINVFRQQVDNPNTVSGGSCFGLNSSFTSAFPYKTHSLCLVLDTNIFVSCLDFIKELRDTKVTDLGYPIIYVPWRVLQELDNLKNSKIDTVDKNLSVNVRRAISYLNDSFKSRHPRIFGQSFEDFARMIDVNTFAADDEILQTCIQLQKQHVDKKLMLLTNDKNLESKAIVSGVEVYSKERFQKKYLKSNPIPSQSSSSVLNESNTDGADSCLCQAKELLKEFLTMLVETEMKIAFEGDWVKLAVRKPPWSLQDVLKCLLKHWRAVFFLSFSKHTHSEAELLNEKLFKKGTVNTQDVVDIIKSIQKLMVSIKKSQKEKRPYVDVIPAKMLKLSNLLKTLTQNQPDAHQPSHPSVSESNTSCQQIFQIQYNSDGDISKVKNLFKEIWDSLRNFCCSLSDIINSSGPSTEVVVQEIRLKLLQTLTEVRELVEIVEKILELNPTDISEAHPVVVHFSNFLIQVYPNMTPTFRNELPSCLTAFFKDFEGRSLISTSLKDFKEFSQDLSKAAEYFNAQFTSST